MSVPDSAISKRRGQLEQLEREPGNRSSSSSKSLDAKPRSQISINPIIILIINPKRPVAPCAPPPLAPPSYNKHSTGRHPTSRFVRAPPPLPSPVSCVSHRLVRLWRSISPSLWRPGRRWLHLQRLASLSALRLDVGPVRERLLEVADAARDVFVALDGKGDHRLLCDKVSA